MSLILDIMISNTYEVSNYMYYYEVQKRNLEIQNWSSWHLHDY